MTRSPRRQSDIFNAGAMRKFAMLGPEANTNKGSVHGDTNLAMRIGRGCLGDGQPDDDCRCGG